MNIFDLPSDACPCLLDGYPSPQGRRILYGSPLPGWPYPIYPSLPTELWMNILSRPGLFTKRDLMNYASVNTMFYDIVLPALWSRHELRFVPYDRSTPAGTYARVDMDVFQAEANAARTLEGFCQLLRSSPGIRRSISTLYLESLYFPSGDARKAAYGFVEPAVLLVVLRRLPKLHTLRLADIAFSYDNFTFMQHSITPRISLSRLSIKFGKNRDYTIDDKDIYLPDALLHPFEHIDTLYWVDRLEDNGLYMELPAHVHADAVEITTRSWMRSRDPPTNLKALHLLPSSPYDGHHSPILDYLGPVALGLQKISISALMCCMDFTDTTALDLLRLCSRVHSLTVYMPLPHDWHRTTYLDSHIADMCQNITGVLLHLASQGLLPELKRLRYMFQTAELGILDPLPQDYVSTAELLEGMDVALRCVALQRRGLSVSVSLGDQSGQWRKREVWEVPLTEIFPRSAGCRLVRFL